MLHEFDAHDACQAFESDQRREILSSVIIRNHSQVILGLEGFYVYFSRALIDLLGQEVELDLLVVFGLVVNLAQDLLRLLLELPHLLKVYLPSLVYERLCLVDELVLFFLLLESLALEVFVLFSLFLDVEGGRIIFIFHMLISLLVHLLPL